MGQSGLREFYNTKILKLRIYPDETSVNCVPTMIDSLGSFLTRYNLRVSGNRPEIQSSLPLHASESSNQLLPPAFLTVRTSRFSASEMDDFSIAGASAFVGSFVHTGIGTTLV